jgi:hypothetical protein
MRTQIALFVGAAAMIGLGMAACSDDDETGDSTAATGASGSTGTPASSSGSGGSPSGPGGAGGEPTTGGAGGEGGSAGGEGGAGGAADCITCNQLFDMNFACDPPPCSPMDLCPGAAADAFMMYGACVCGPAPEGCGTECAMGPCMGNPPGDQACIDCKTERCQDEFDACLAN